MWMGAKFIGVLSHRKEIAMGVHKCIACGAMMTMIGLNLYCNRCPNVCSLFNPTGERYISRLSQLNNSAFNSVQSTFAGTFATSSGIFSGNSYKLNFHENISVTNNTKIDIS